MTKWILLYYVHKNIPMVPFLYIIKLVLFFLIILNNIRLWKSKFKNQNILIWTQIKWTTFCEIHIKILLVMDEKVPKVGHLSVL